jgi:hypothetical protein
MKHIYIAKKLILVSILCVSGMVLAHAQAPKTDSAATAPIRQKKVLSPEDSLQRLVNNQPDSLRHGFFHAGKFHSSFHAQFEGDFALVFSKKAAIAGIQLAWVVNHKLSFGLHYDILSSPLSINKLINSYDSVGGKANTINVTNMSATVTVGYILRSSKKVSIEPMLGVGWTEVLFTDPRAGWIDKTEDKFINGEFHYVMVNPSLNVIWNATKYFRVGAVVGARVVLGPDYIRMKSYRVGGVYAGIFLRFGTF